MKKTVIAFLLLGVGLSLVAMEKEKLEIVDQILAGCAEERQRNAEHGGYYSIYRSQSDLSFVREIRAKFLDNIQASVTMINGSDMGWFDEEGQLDVELSIEKREQTLFRRCTEAFRCLEYEGYISAFPKFMDCGRSIEVTLSFFCGENEGYKDLLRERIQFLDDIYYFFKNR